MLELGSRFCFQVSVFSAVVVSNNHRLQTFSKQNKKYLLMYNLLTISSYVLQEKLYSDTASPWAWQSNWSQGEISHWSLIPAKQRNYTMEGQKTACITLSITAGPFLLCRLTFASFPSLSSHGALHSCHLRSCRFFLSFKPWNYHCRSSLPHSTR